MSCYVQISTSKRYCHLNYHYHCTPWRRHILPCTLQCPRRQATLQEIALGDVERALDGDVVTDLVTPGSQIFFSCGPCTCFGMSQIVSFSVLSCVALSAERGIAMLILNVCLSVRLSITLAYCGPLGYFESNDTDNGIVFCNV